MAMPVKGWNDGRANNLVGMNRDNAPSKAIDPGTIARITSGVRGWLGRTEAPGGRELPFFPPGIPMVPIAPGAAGRRFDYPTNYNAVTRPRSYEPIDFDTLRAVSDPSVGGWDLIRIAIETRKDQMSKLKFSIMPRKPADANVRPKSTPRCQEIESFMRRPDRQHSWADWIRMLIEEHLVIDAATIYRHQTLGGDVAKLVIIDGSSIQPRLGYDGRRPSEPGETAYTQVLKGLPAVDYTAEEMIYAPRNPRTNKVYGYSPVEQVMVTINIGLRRQISQLGYFTDGSVPDAVAGVPADWNVQKIKEYQDYWDSMINDAVTRRKLKFIPGGVTFQPTRNDQALVDQFDEWLARVVQYCFSLPPSPLVRMMNRATSENAYEQSLDEGLQPLMIWAKDIIDDIISRWFNEPGLEMVWDDIRKVDPAEKEQRDIVLSNEGAISLDDIRADRGMEPLGIEPFVKGLGPLGFMSIKAMKQAMANGWDLTGMPQPGLGMTPGAGEMGASDPAQLGTGQDGDPLNGLPPEILQALGVDPGGATPEDGGDAGDGPPVSHIPDDQPITPNPGNGGGSSNVVPIHKHPAVQAALQQGEAHAKRLAARMGGR